MGAVTMEESEKRPPLAPKSPSKKLPPTSSMPTLDGGIMASSQQTFKEIPKSSQVWSFEQKHKILITRLELVRNWCWAARRTNLRLCNMVETDLMQIEFECISAAEIFIIVVDPHLLRIFWHSHKCWFAHFTISHKPSRPLSEADARLFFCFP